MRSSQAVSLDKSEPKMYGSIDLFMGPGDDHGFLGIQLMYDSAQKIQYVQWQGSGSVVSKSLFERDLAPSCYQAISRIKEILGKLEYDTIYLVKENKVDKIKP